MLTIGDGLNQVQMNWAVNKCKSAKKMGVHLRQVSGYFAALPFKNLTQSAITGYVMKRQHDGMANGTINRELAVLRRACRLACEEGFLEQVPSFHLLREDNVRQGTYTMSEVDLLEAQLPVHYRPVVRFAYLTGRRRGEILQIQWGDVDLGRKLITIRQGTTKTGQPDSLPMSHALFEFMLDLWEVRRESCPWVFHWRGQPLGDFSGTFKRARERAGLPEKHFHDFRRTVATELIEAGVSESVAMRVTGHKTNKVFARYNIVKTETTRDAMDKLSEYREKNRE